MCNTKPISCPRCHSLSIIKNGKSYNQKQRYRCKACFRQFLIDYTYQGCIPQLRALIVLMTMNGSGIHDICRVLKISINTVLKTIRQQAPQVAEPVVPARMCKNPPGFSVYSNIMRSLRSESWSDEAKRFLAMDLNSPAKVAAILFDKLGVPQNKSTQGGKQSVDRQALNDVRGYHPAVDALLRFREVDKLASTFVNVLPSFADACGRIHPEFKSLGAKTGRFSCSNPNVQQIPARSELGKQLRQAFVPAEGRKLVVADYSQMELRVLAYYSKDPLLVEAYTSGTETDLHTLAALLGHLTLEMTERYTYPYCEYRRRAITTLENYNFGHKSVTIDISKK